MTKQEKMITWLHNHKYRYVPEMNLYTKYLKDTPCTIYVTIDWADKLTGSSDLDKISHGILSDYLYINIANIVDITAALGISDREYFQMIKECAN